MSALDKLTPFELEVMEILCLCYRAMSAADLSSVLKVREVLGENGKPATVAGLVQTLERLKARKLVVPKGKNWYSARDITEIITRRMAAEGRLKAALPVVKSFVAPSARWGYSASYVSDDELVGLIRIAIHDRDFKQLKTLLDAYFQRPRYDDNIEIPTTRVINNPFDADWLATFPSEMQGTWLTWLLHDLSTACKSVESALPYATALVPTLHKNDRFDLGYAIGNCLFLQGRFDEIPALAADIGLVGELLVARCELATGDIAAAIDRYEAALLALKQATRKRKPTFGTTDWVFFIMALIAGGDEYAPRAIELAEWGSKEKGTIYQHCCGALLRFLRIQNGQISGSTSYSPYTGNWQLERGTLMKYLTALVEFWAEGGENLKQGQKTLIKLCEEAGSEGYFWIERELAQLIERLGARMTPVGAVKTMPLVDHFHSSEPWERTLKALAQISRGEGAAKSEHSTRLVWMLHFRGGYCTVEPLEQKRSAGGHWSKGRVVALQRLRENAETLGYLSAHDRRVCGYIKSETDGGYWNRHRTSYYLSLGALSALVGHPNVFLADTGANVEVAAGCPALEVRSTKKGFVLKVTPRPGENALFVAEREGDLRVVIYEFTAELARIAEMLGDGLSVPARAKDRVLEAVRNAASVVTVHSDLGVGDESIPQVDADLTPVLQLLPSGEGLLVKLRVRPLPGGPAFVPAVGGEMVIAEVNGARMQTARDMKQETARADLLVSSCASLVSADLGASEWRLETPDAALEFLSELQNLPVEVRVEWPKGQKFALRGTAGAGQFRAKINAGHNWFDVSGEIKVDDDLVLDMQRLLELTAGTRSRFVALGDGQFLALTQAFKRKLDELRDVGVAADGVVRLHALAAPLMEGFIEETAALQANKRWKDQMARMREARDLKPEVSSTLQAVLREYQVAGFEWLARLAAWGVGACLADDMGLGKTVQLLALMLRRAPGGPQLVIAPTSVCANWEDEAARFAPTLRVYRLGLNNRASTVENLGAYDLLICSYGLLQTETALLKSISWETIVLDEAQAIKNSATKRSKAAMQLEGAFKVAATGTPIENHLGELWNLFHFINPGFLGTQQQFNGRFALPIEKYENKDAGRHLKQLIQPFILRRRKAEVLSELPARTDIVLQVELGDEERAFYEALRRNALMELSGLGGSAGKNHVRILAEIMRLRRACCNTRLVDEDSSLPSAKLEVFEALLDELMENGHKALVFSQFVDHLTILRGVLERKGIAFQYLDGGTPAAARKRAVDSFQSGQGEIFLISLKAGGLGLNLTAADYVIHMDPWWNPAVEDQASDRAHRIGQQRPVTVYRLVTKGTIEAQITDLHLRKRDLANSLLEGADMAGKISAEELLELLRMG